MPNTPLKPIVGSDLHMCDPADLCRQIARALSGKAVLDGDGNRAAHGAASQSVVLTALGQGRLSSGGSVEPYMILNKRSQRVRQPGDICFPGGGIEPRRDALLAALLRLPGSPLRKWADHARWQRRRAPALNRLRLLLATALREGFEEMRLNPLGVRFLGILPSEALVMFRRTIHPLVVWVDGRQRFRPNWEVERVVRIPLRELFIHERYVCYRLTMPPAAADAVDARRLDFPAFRFTTADGPEILWGATFRIVLGFMRQVFGFRPPDTESLEVIDHRLPPHYLTGRT
jgi:8-oxo-dGTP pyrophosphatase MutT (NUDIX family)